MSSSNKTPYLYLNSFLGSDVPKRMDFNTDNLIIDQAIKGHAQDLNRHFTGNEKLQVNQMFYFTGYMGNGQATKPITLPFSPAFVIVYCVSEPLFKTNFTTGLKYNNVGFATQGEGTWGLQLQDKILTVEYSPTSNYGELKCMNALGTAYTVVAIRGNLT